MARWTPWLAILALTLAGCSGASDIDDLGTRAVLIGIDGADWKLIDALVAEGELPNLQRLREQGTSGPIATLSDIALSPVIWTSVATGKSATKHGVAWFMVDRADGTRAPVRSYNRQSKAIWNVLGERDRRPVVLGWWATYPAEDVGPGIVLSDGLGYHGFGSTARDGDDTQKTYPAELFEEVSSLVPTEDSIPADFARRFIHLAPEEYEAEMFRPARDQGLDPQNPVHLFQQYAVTAQGYTAIAETLLARETYDLFMVYFEQVDSFSHLFMKYAPPRLDWVEPHEFERYRDVVTEWYKYQDELLGRLLTHIDLDETAVFVLSDHGFKSGERRIRSERTIDIRKAHLDHERDGIFIAAGPHIRKGAEIPDASVLDITPTILRYLGFPVARDMDGKVLEAIFEPAFRGEHPVRTIDTYEDKQDAPPPEEIAQDLSEEQIAEQLRRLEALGYVGGGEPAPNGQESSPEIHNNLGRIHLSRGELDEAQAEFDRALALDQDNAEALLNLGMIQRIKGRTADAEHLVKRALRMNPNSIRALAELAEIKRDTNDLDESIRLYREALAIDDSQPFVHIGLGDSLQRAGEFEQAQQVFESVLQLDPDSFVAHYNLGVTYLSRQRLEEAVEWFERALELEPGHPSAAYALNNLGDIHTRRGEIDLAIASFQRAVEVSPGHLESRYNLASLYMSRGKIGEAIELLEQASRIQPDSEPVHGSLGMAYLLEGRNEEAYKSFLLVRRLYPRNWIGPFGLALLHAGSGQPDKAKELLDEALGLGGNAAREEAARYPVLEGILN